MKAPWIDIGLPKSIEDKIILLSEKGCWIWGAAKTNGYGVVQHNGRVHRAHRVVYEIIIGPILDNLELDHLCVNRPCVNPYHMEPVTGTVNILRGNSMSARHARQTLCKRGHPLSGENLFLRKRGHKVERTCLQCCRMRDKNRYLRSSEREVEECKL